MDKFEKLQEWLSERIDNCFENGPFDMSAMQEAMAISRKMKELKND